MTPPRKKPAAKKRVSGSRPSGPAGPRSGPSKAGGRPPAGRPGQPHRPGFRPEGPKTPLPPLPPGTIQGPGRGSPTADLAIVGAGAAGMAAAIFAAESSPGLKIVLLESARRPGAKILVSGGGRCNVTNEAVTPADFSGGPSTIVRNVLRAFDEHRTLAWMSGLGVKLKLEPTGKYFPESDEARTVVAGLFARLGQLKIELRTGVKANRLLPVEGGFEIYAAQQKPEVRATRVIMATGGLALPRSGSDGAGLRWMRAVGHTVVPTTPALAPLLVKEGPWGKGSPSSLSGLTVDGRLTLMSGSGKKLAETTGSLLFTHFGLSGPCAMNFSRHLARHRLESPGDTPQVGLGLSPFGTLEEADAWLQEQGTAHPKRQVATVLEQQMPERLAAIFTDKAERIGGLTRERRLDLARGLVAAPIQVEGDRGYAFAETTAGGVDLREIDPATMESRKVPGLHLCGEILDVDGRIGGFNFQWAWSTGHLAGRAAARELERDRSAPSAERPSKT